MKERGNYWRRVVGKKQGGSGDVGIKEKIMGGSLDERGIRWMEGGGEF